MSVLYTFHLCSPIPDASLTAQTTQAKHIPPHCFACIILTMLKNSMACWNLCITVSRSPTIHDTTKKYASYYNMLNLYVDEKIAITDDSCFMDRALWGMALLLVSTSQETKHVV